ncbi:MAG: metallophosphoesterase [Flavobacteriaceae bacterium]
MQSIKSASQNTNRTFRNILAFMLIGGLVIIPFVFNSCKSDDPTPPPDAGTPFTPENHKVAFIGDTGAGDNFQVVLDLIKNENANAVMHNGDLSYAEEDDQAEIDLLVPQWYNMVKNTLGDTFPYFACVGNHEQAYWHRYADLLEPHMTANGITWTGDYGIMSSFSYKGIFYVITNPNDQDNDSWAGDSNFIRDKHASSNSRWKLSVFHRNQTKMQLGSKYNETGWRVYKESRKAGAIIQTAHEHSYHRTFELKNCQNTQVSHFDDTQSNPIILRKDNSSTTIDEGTSFVSVNGLGGVETRDQDRCLSGFGQGVNGDCQIWAKVYTSDQGSKYGAQFAVFNYNGDENLSYWYFKNIDGEVIDEFYVRTTL